ncbi:hypothetical protein Tco_0045427 [Tanacetum coccineum]
MSDNPTPSSDFVVESPSPSPIPYEDSDSLVEETDTLLPYFNDSSPDYETFCFDIEEKSCGSTTTHSDHSLSDYDVFYFDDDHIKERVVAVPLLILIFLFLNMNRLSLIFRLIRFLLPIGLFLIKRSSLMNSLTSYLHRNERGHVARIERRIILEIHLRSERHEYLRFKDLEYTDADIMDFEERLGMIYSRGIHRMLVLDFESLPTVIRERFIEAIVDIDAEAEEMETAGFGLYWAESARHISNKGDLNVGSVNIPYLLARYLRLFASGRKYEAMISGGQFAARLAEYFGLLTEELDDTWAWVAPGPERQQVAAAGASEVTEGAPDVDEGD